MAKTKAVVRLRLADAMDRLDRMILLIARDVDIALRVEAALDAANDLAMGELRGAEIHGADCYNHGVRGSMSLFLSLILAKLFETPSLRGQFKSTRFNKSDVASIPLMIRLLEQQRCRKRLINRARNWIPGGSPSMSERSAQACERAIDRAIAVYAKLRSTLANRKAVATLRLFRNKVLAHTLLGPALDIAPSYGELFILMDVARDVVQHARLAIEGTHVDLREDEEHIVEICRAFWQRALTATVKVRPAQDQDHS